MKLTLRWIYPLILGIALIFTAPAMAQDCITFQDILHCPVGQAGLGQSSRGLHVMGLGVDGDDGVASLFPTSTHWRARWPRTLKPQTHTRLSAISAVETTSELSIEPTGDLFQVRATFTGNTDRPTYSVLVYHQGILQAALGGFYGGEDPNSQLNSFYQEGIDIGIIDNDEDDDEDDEEEVDFHIAPNGGCNWGLSFAEQVEVSLPDGTQVLGDEIRFMEDVHGSGHYPYLGFESIEIRSSAAAFTLSDEFVDGSL